MWHKSKGALNITAKKNEVKKLLTVCEFNVQFKRLLCISMENNFYYSNPNMVDLLPVVYKVSLRNQNIS